MKVSLKLLMLVLVLSAAPYSQARNDKSFTVSTYVIQGTVQAMINGRLDPAESWSTFTRNLKVDKVYIEVMRNYTLVDEAGLEKVVQFFKGQGVQVCGGLAYSVSESNGYQGFDYADPEQRAFAQKAVELAARHFREQGA
jgi:hypothetical protein